MICDKAITMHALRPAGLAGGGLHPGLAPTAHRHRPLIVASVPPVVEGRAASSCPGLTVRLDRAGRRVALRGEFDVAAVAALDEVTALLLHLRPGDCTIDLDGVTFIDAAGLGCMVRFANRLAAHHARVIVVGASPRVRRIFDIGQLGGLLAAP